MTRVHGPSRLAMILALALIAPIAVISSGSVAGQEKTTVTMWLDPSFSAGEAECNIEQAVTPFNEQSETIRVDVTLQPKAWDATRTAVAGGAGPDVVITPGPTHALELAKAGHLVPLDDYVSQYGWTETFVPWALDLGKVDGQLYSIPDQLETIVLYYNKTLFEEHGWEPPRTIDELMALSEEVAAAGIIPFAHANADWRGANEWFAGELFNHHAGPQAVYDALTGETKWTEPAFVESIDMLNTMQQNGWFMGGLDNYYTTTNEDRHGALGSGEAAMNIEGTWILAEIDDYFGEEAGNANEWDWVPVPSATGDAIFDIGIGQTYSINSAADDPEAVAEFLSFYFSPEVRARVLNFCGTAPAPVSLEGQDLPDVDARAAAIFEGLNAAAAENNYGYTTYTFWPPETEVYLNDTLEQVWAGNMTSQEYLEGLQATFDEEFGAGTLPPIPSR